MIFFLIINLLITTSFHAEIQGRLTELKSKLDDLKTGLGSLKTSLGELKGALEKKPSEKLTSTEDEQKKAAIDTLFKILSEAANQENQQKIQEKAETNPDLFFTVKGENGKPLIKTLLESKVSLDNILKTLSKNASDESIAQAFSSQEDFNALTNAALENNKFKEDTTLMLWNRLKKKEADQKTQAYLFSLTKEKIQENKEELATLCISSGLTDSLQILKTTLGKNEFKRTIQDNHILSKTMHNNPETFVKILNLYSNDPNEVVPLLNTKSQHGSTEYTSYSHLLINGQGDIIEKLYDVENSPHTESIKEAINEMNVKTLDNIFANFTKEQGKFTKVAAFLLKIKKDELFKEKEDSERFKYLFNIWFIYSTEYVDETKNLAQNILFNHIKNTAEINTLKQYSDCIFRNEDIDFSKQTHVQAIHLIMHTLLEKEQTLLTDKKVTIPTSLVDQNNKTYLHILAEKYLLFSPTTPFGASKDTVPEYNKSLWTRMLIQPDNQNKLPYHYLQNEIKKKQYKSFFTNDLNQSSENIALKKFQELIDNPT